MVEASVESALCSKQGMREVQQYGGDARFSEGRSAGCFALTKMHVDRVYAPVSDVPSSPARHVWSS